METKVDHFAHKSKAWDMNSTIVQNAKGIAELIVKNIKLNKSAHAGPIRTASRLVLGHPAVFVSDS